MELRTATREFLSTRGLRMGEKRNLGKVGEEKKKERKLRNFFLFTRSGLHNPPKHTKNTFFNIRLNLLAFSNIKVTFSRKFLSYYLILIEYRNIRLSLLAFSNIKVTFSNIRTLSLILRYYIKTTFFEFSGRFL